MGTELLRKLVTYAARVGGYGFLAVAVMICVDTIIRKTLKISIVGSTEISGFVFALATGTAMAFTVLLAGHIRVDVLQNFLPRTVAAVLNVAAAVSLVLVGGILVWNEALLLNEALEYQATSTLLDFPLWIPHLLFLSALVLFVVASLVMLMQQLRHFPNESPALGGDAGADNPFDIPDDAR